MVAERLLPRAPAHVTVKEVAGDGTQLMEAWFGFDRAVVIDAVQSGAAPGAVHRLDGRAMPPPGQMRLSSTHSLGLAEALKLGQRLGELPREVEIVGIEGCRFEVGAPCSDAVLAAVERACELLLAEETL